MKIFKFFFTVVLLSTTLQVFGECNQCSEPETMPSVVRSLIIPRDQGANTARELVGLQDAIHRPVEGENYGVAAAVFEYTHTFRAMRIAHQLFGCGDSTSGSRVDVVNKKITANCGCPNNNDYFFLRFQGSEVDDRQSTSILADYFGLSQNFDGTLRLKPTIENFIVDLEYFVGFDCWIPGLWFRTNIPITLTRWHLFDDERDPDCASSQERINCPRPRDIPTGETCFSVVTTPFPTCYMADDPMTPASSILQALSGDFTFGDMQTKWKFGKFSKERLSETRAADVDLILGYDFCRDDYSHFGLFVQASAPSGNAPKAEFIFEPIAGNGHHWGLGGGITMHGTMFENECGQRMTIWFVGNAQHLFWDTQLRSFDFKQQGILSRYMLLKEFDTDGNYTGRLINGINFATRAVRTRMKVMGDMSVKLAYYNNGFNADLGYNVWGRAREEVQLCSKNANACFGLSDIDDNRFGFKGCQGVCTNNFLATDAAGDRARGNEADPATSLLNSTQSSATIFRCGTGVDNGQFITPSPVPVGDANDPTTFTRLTWDGTPENATDLVTTNPNVLPDDIVEGVIFAQSSNPPSLLTSDDLNYLGARASLTHKVFAYVGYEWFEAEFMPFVGLFGEVEFDARRADHIKCPTPDGSEPSKSFRDRSINQWGLGIKVGCAF